MANFNDRLTYMEKLLNQLMDRVADLEYSMYEEPLVDSDEEIEDTDHIKHLKQCLAQVNIEIDNLKAPGANVIEFKALQG